MSKAGFEKGWTDTKNIDEPQLLKAEEVAKMLKIAKVTPYQWARRGILPYYRLEGTIRFKMEDIKAFIEARRVEKRG
jgi:excisionase family DNA binding protein